MNKSLKSLIIAVYTCFVSVGNVSADVGYPTDIGFQVVDGVTYYCDGWKCYPVDSNENGQNNTVNPNGGDAFDYFYLSMITCLIALSNTQQNTGDTFNCVMDDVMNNSSGQGPTSPTLP